MEVKLMSRTEGVGEMAGLTIGQMLAYIARVSNPSNQQNHETSAKLLAYCLKNQHWSVFESASLTVEIVTSRAIAQQILRHRSFTFQEFSQRYAEAVDFEIYEARRQDTKNRQNSIDDLDEETKGWFETLQDSVNKEALRLYRVALNAGVAKEQARFLLPLSVQTRLYMTGNIRSWLTYCQLRCKHGTQLEHKEIALACKAILLAECPELEAAFEPAAV